MFNLYVFIITDEIYVTIFVIEGYSSEHSEFLLTSNNSDLNANEGMKENLVTPIGSLMTSIITSQIKLMNNKICAFLKFQKIKIKLKTL